MTNTGNDSTNKPVVSDAAEEEMHVYEDEINLMDYFLVLWKHKWLILICSVLPALIVALVICYSPRNYEVIYTYDVRGDARGYDRDNVRGYDRDNVRGYDRDNVRGYNRNDVSDWNLNEKNFNVLQSGFYSKENIDKIINKLRESGLDQYAKQMTAAANKSDGLKNLLKFEPVPAYIDLSETKIADAEQLEKLRQLKALLLKMTITGKPKNDMHQISAAIRDNLEKITSVYMVQGQLSTEIQTYKAMMADIESHRFSLELTLKTNNSALEKLKNMKSQVPDEVDSNVLLQFDVGVKSEYLPLGYQIQALESEIVSIERQVETDKENYKYYEKLSVLNEKLLAEIEKNISSYYTIGQYRSFLIKLIGDYEAEELKDYLASYIKKIENRIAVSVPITKNPAIYPLAKGTVKKSGLVFAVALIMSVFASFLSEGLKKSQASVS
jgi:subunit length determinant Wzz-like protein